MTTVAKDRQGAQDLAPLLTVKEMAAVLGVHIRSVWRLAALAEAGGGNFPRPVRIAKRTIRWRRGDLEKYLSDLAAEASRRSGGSEDEPDLGFISL